MTRRVLIIETDVLVGASIEEACTEAVELAEKSNACVRFKFIDTSVLAHPGDTPALLAKWWRKERLTT